MKEYCECVKKRPCIAQPGGRFMSGDIICFICDKMIEKIDHSKRIPNITDAWMDHHIGHSYRFNESTWIQLKKNIYELVINKPISDDEMSWDAINKKQEENAKLADGMLKLAKWADKHGLHDDSLSDEAWYIKFNKALRKK